MGLTSHRERSCKLAGTLAGRNPIDLAQDEVPAARGRNARKVCRAFRPLVQRLWERVCRARVILNRARHTRWAFVHKIVRTTLTGGATTKIMPSTVHFDVPKIENPRSAEGDFRDASHAHF